MALALASVGGYLTLMRPHHWVKNAFVAAPLFFTPAAVNSASLVAVGLGIASFSAVASSIYVLNDFCDREADRSHPTKRERPLAAGTVKPAGAFALMALLLAGGLLLAWLL
jgi:4-hydroxybenzoate polyprenyltransferase